jgi:hypothetical protein
MNTQSRDADIKAIHEAVEDYYSGWYTANPERMKRCLHPDLAKRTIRLDEAGKEYLLNLSKKVMVDATTKGGGSGSPAEKQTWTISLLDCYEEIANVKVASGEYREYIHLARQDSQWLIVNALYASNRGYNSVSESI